MTEMHGQKDPALRLEGLSKSLKDRGKGETNEIKKTKGLPPVHLWNPPFQGDIPMEIKRDGTWTYMGTPISRKAMVKLFSTILRYDDDGKYYLVTPVEKVGIKVEDAPFLAVELEVKGTKKDQKLTFRTQTDDWVTADQDHPVRCEINPETGEPSPYVLVRSNLEARINRNVFYELVDLGEIELVDGQKMFGVRSEGTFFPFSPASEVGI